VSLEIFGLCCTLYSMDEMAEKEKNRLPRHLISDRRPQNCSATGSLFFAVSDTFLPDGNACQKFAMLTKGEGEGWEVN
jgi:hypothetical protein